MSFFSSISIAMAALALGSTILTAHVETGWSSGYETRKRILIDQIADRYTPTEFADKGKYSFPVVIARIDQYGPEDERAAGYIREYAEGKYGFFHFPFVGLARIMGLYPEADIILSSREPFLREILFHDPLFHYNALTGEGTENHVGMSRTSGYLFAQEALAYPELSGRAREWMDQLKPWILQWASRIFHYGTGEWDSSVYTTYNMIGWFNLYDFSQDEEIRMAARAVLDYYSANVALKYTDGIYGGPESRGKTRYGPYPGTATEYLGWLWFGPEDPRIDEGFFKGSEFIQTIHAITSTYHPPAALVELGRKAAPAPAAYRLSKPDYLLTEAAESNEFYLIDHSFTAGTVQTPYGGWSNTAYGVVNWKVVMRDALKGPAVLWGNGGMKSTRHARGRNPFDQFFQHGRTIVQMTRVPGEAEELSALIEEMVKVWREDFARDFRKRWNRNHREHPGPVGDESKGSLETAGLSLVYLPDGIERVQRDSVHFIRWGSTVAAIRPLGTGEPGIRGNAIVDTAPRDRVSGFVIELSTVEDPQAFDSFIDEYARQTSLTREGDGKFHYMNLEGETLTFEYAASGKWRELQADFGYGVTEQRVGFNSEEWKQPEWPEGHNHGRIPTVRVNGEGVDPLPSGTVISGPQLRLVDRRLQVIEAGTVRYEVDYSGALPVFTEHPH